MSRIWCKPIILCWGLTSKSFCVVCVRIPIILASIISYRLYPHRAKLNPHLTTAHESSPPNLCVSRGCATGAVITQPEQRRANRKPRSRANHIPPALPLFRMNTSDVPTQSLHRAAPRERRRRRKEAQTMGHPAGWISAYAHDKLVRGKVPGGRECMSTRNNE